MSDYLNQFDLNHRVTIIRVSEYSDSYCNKVTQATTLLSSGACAVWQTVGNEVVIGDRIHNPINYTMAIKPSTNYRATDKAIISGSSFRMGNPHNVANENRIMVYNLESIE